MKKIFVLTLILFLGLVHFTYAQTMDPPWSWDISSDYGPRNIPKGSLFHKGIDYGGPNGAGINPVEDGTIKQIKYGGGWHIDVSGSNGIWMYIHIFSGNDTSSPSPSGNWELIRKAILVDQNNGTTVERNVIIYWSGNKAEKVLSRTNNYWVKDSSGNYIYGLDNNKITTRKSVLRSEEIAPVGNSGTKDPHLHLKLIGSNSNDINPLYYLVHTPDNVPAVSIIKPENNHCFQEGEISTYSFKVYIDSTQVNGKGLDLDQVTFTIHVNDDPNLVHILGATPTFRYGGDPFSKENTLVLEQYHGGVTSGVTCPFQVIGKDTFFLYQPFNGLNLPPGRHSFVVTASDVNGNLCMPDTHYFTIGSDTVPPVISGISFSLNPANSSSSFTATIADSLSNVVQAC